MIVDTSYTCILYMCSHTVDVYLTKNNILFTRKLPEEPEAPVEPEEPEEPDNDNSVASVVAMEKPNNCIEYYV